MTTPKTAVPTSRWRFPYELRFERRLEVPRWLSPLVSLGAIVVALLLGIRDGRTDSKLGRPPYVFALLTERPGRADRLEELLEQLTVPLVLAVGLDIVFQLVIRGTLRPIASLVYATLFVALPYAAARGASNRMSTLAGRRRRPV